MKRTAKKILVVEDDWRISMALAIRLEAIGYQAITAPNGYEGLRMAVDESPDLIVMDIWMPVGLGFSVAQRLQMLGLQKIPIIFITGSKLDGIKKAADAVGAAAFFEKPYDANHLLQTIARLLEPESDHHPAAAH